MTVQVIKQGARATIIKDCGIYSVSYPIMTASGFATVRRIRSSLAAAERMFDEKEHGSIGTNGYELHTAAEGV